MRKDLINKVTAAFFEYKETYIKEKDLTWESILDKINKSEEYAENKLSKQKLQRFFGTAGKTSYFKQPVWYQSEEEEFFKLIEIILRGYGHKLQKGDDNVPLIREGTFEFEELPSTEENVETKFSIHYWSRKDAVNKGILTLKNNRAVLVINYAKAIVTLKGNYSERGSTIFIHLEDSANPTVNPKSQIIFRKTSEYKDYYIGVFSTANWPHKFPVAGLIIVENLLTEHDDLPNNESLIKYLLAYKRFNIEHGEFSMEDIDKEYEHLPVYVKEWNLIKKFWGSYESFFINPIEGKFEKSLLAIYESGEIKLWVPGDVQKPYSGIVKIYEDSLIIYADFEPKMDDYRIRILIYTEGYDMDLYKENLKTYYGIFTGFPRHSTKPAISRFALRRINSAPIKKIKDYDGELNTIDLTKTNGIKEFDALLQQLHLFDFFYGKEDPQLSSMALLYQLKGKDL